MIYLNSKLLNQVKYLQDTTDYSFMTISFKKSFFPQEKTSPQPSPKERELNF